MVIMCQVSLENYQWKIECFLEDLFLGGQSSIILGYRRLSVKFLPVIPTCQARTERDLAHAYVGWIQPHVWSHLGFLDL